MTTDQDILYRVTRTKRGLTRKIEISMDVDGDGYLTLVGENGDVVTYGMSKSDLLEMAATIRQELMP